MSVSEIHGSVCPILYAQYADYGWTPIKKLSGQAPQFDEDSLQILKAV